MTIQYALALGGSITSSRSSSDSGAGKDGSDIGATYLRTVYGWEKLLRFNWYGDNRWDYSGVVRGYPALVGVGGQ